MRSGNYPLPAEVIFLVIDLLDFPDIIRLSLICRWWREVAFRHPLYCRNIDIDFGDDTSRTRALGLATAQLQRSSRSKVHIRVYSLLDDAKPQDELCINFFSALRTNIHRVQELQAITGHHAMSAFLAWAFDIQGRCPALRRLVLTGRHSDVLGTSTISPLLAAAAPGLRQLDLRDVAFRPTAAFTFCNLHTLEIRVASQNLDVEVALPQHLNKLLPQLRNLLIYGTRLAFRFPNPMPPTLQAWIGRLQELRLEHFIFGTIPPEATYGVQTIHVMRPSHTTIDTFLGSIPDRTLGMRICLPRHKEIFATACIEETAEISWRRTREACAPLHTILESSFWRLSPRITYLSIPASLTPAVAERLPWMPLLHTLAITLDTELQNVVMFQSTGPIYAPEIRSLKLIKGCYASDSDSIVLFVKAAIRSSPDRLLHLDVGEVDDHPGAVLDIIKPGYPNLLRFRDVFSPKSVSKIMQVLVTKSSQNRRVLNGWKTFAAPSPSPVI